MSAWGRAQRAKGNNHVLYSMLYALCVLCGNIYLINSSAICTAFSAAPLRRLSETIHMFIPLGIDSSSLILPTYVSSLPATSMAPEYRHANGGGSDPDGIVFHDLLRLVHHLHLFPGVAVVQKGVDVREAVESDLVRIDLCLDRFEIQERHGLSGEFVYGLFPRAGYGLERGDHDALDLRRVVDRLQDHDHADGGAVRIGDDAVVRGDGMRIHLGHHERDLRVHAECARVVYHHGARCRSGRGELMAPRSARGKKRNINALEGILLELLNRPLTAAEVKPLACRPVGRKENERGHREVALFEDVDHLPANNSCRACNGNYVFVFFLEHYL